MNGNKAFFAGVAGAVLITALTAMARALGMAVNMEMMLGSMITQTLGLGTWFLGLFMHLVIGGIFGLIYAYAFENWTHRSDWKIGTGFGAIHAVIAGLLLAAIPYVHPLITELRPAPGMFMANLGSIGVVAFVVLHLLYGALVGGMYAPVTVPRQRTAGAAA